MFAIALLALLLVQDPDVDALLQQLSDESIVVRDKATAALVALGEKIEEKVKTHVAMAGADAKARCDTILKSIRRTRRLKEVLPPVKKVTLKFKNAPLSDVLGAFKEQTGWPVEISKKSSVSVTLDVRDATPFEALQAIAHQAGMDYRIDNERTFDTDMDIDEAMSDEKKPPRLRFDPGARPGRPLLLKSRYAVAVSEIDLWRQTDFGTPLVRADLAANLMCPPDLKPDESSQVLIDLIVDDTGAVLYDRSKERPEFPGFDPLERKITFEHPRPKARKLASIKGRAAIRYLLSHEKMVFESPEKSVGVRKTHKDVEILLKSWKRDGSALIFEVEISGSRPDDPHGTFMASRGVEGKGILIRTKDGSLWSSGNMRGGPPGKSAFPIQLTFSVVPEEITEVVIIVERDFHTDEIDFEFKDIPLP